MLKKVVIPGLLGGLVLLLWTFIANGILGFRTNVDMKQIPNERELYQILQKSIPEPGRYICNPEITASEMFPENEPVFSILYGGVGHESAGGQAMRGLLIFLITPVLGAWLLSKTSLDFRKSYLRKVLFFSVIGILIALFKDIQNSGIGDYPFNDALLHGMFSFVSWTLAGIVVGWRMKFE